MGKVMSDISRDQVLKQARFLIERKLDSFEEISVDDFASITDDQEIDLFSLFSELGSLKTEMKQINRLENKRIETLKDFFDNEKTSKKRLLEKIEIISAEKDKLKFKNLIFSIIETKDFVESLEKSLDYYFKPKRIIPFFGRKSETNAQKAIKDYFLKIIAKLNLILEKESVYPVNSDAIQFDPSFMKAVEITCDNAKKDNQTTETIETGYLHNQRVIRFAKVIVNKLSNNGE
jgi:molecular chaperone GrpE (heat shock protein)